jgi:hypothetical protein
LTFQLPDVARNIDGGLRSLQSVPLHVVGGRNDISEDLYRSSEMLD